MGERRGEGERGEGRGEWGKGERRGRERGEEGAGSGPVPFPSKQPNPPRSTCRTSFGFDGSSSSSLIDVGRQERRLERGRGGRGKRKI